MQENWRLRHGAVALKQVLVKLLASGWVKLCIRCLIWTGILNFVSAIVSSVLF